MDRMILGIDPGKMGGWVVLDGREAVVASGRTDILDERALADTVDFLVVNCPGLYAVLERAQAFPKMGVSGAFHYGQGYGFWQGVLCGSGIGFETVPAVSWQKALGLAGAGGGRKNQVAHKRALIAEARRRWPILPNHSGICDAALIACYGFRMRKGVWEEGTGP